MPFCSEFSCKMMGLISAARSRDDIETVGGIDGLGFFFGTVVGADCFEFFVLELGGPGPLNERGFPRPSPGCL